MARFALQWPRGGVNENAPFSEQPDGTSPSMQNVRAYEQTTGRNRGGQRSGLTRYINAQVSGANRIQDINRVLETAAYSGTSSLSVRAITGVVVSNGTVKSFSPGDSSYTAVTSGSSALDSTAPVIFSDRWYDDLFFADGTNYKYYDTSANEVKSWTASSGSLPSNGTEKARLIATWRNRIVLSGLDGDGQNYFMSAVGDFQDFDYTPASTTSTQAVAGNAGNAATIPDKINCIIPWTKDLLIFGCDHSIHMMSGDPAAGGRVDQIETQPTGLGIAWGRPYAIAPGDILFFFGNWGGVYFMTPESGPSSITDGVLKDELADINLSSNLVRMAYHQRENGLSVFVSPLTAGATTHYYYDIRNDAWSKDVFGDNNHNPIAVHEFEGDSPDDRTVLIGSEDGYVRNFDSSTKNDDGTAIDSFVWFGPIFRPMTAHKLKELQVTLGSSSDDVSYDFFIGNTPEEAFNASSFLSGTLSSGRNASIRRGVRAGATYVRLRNNTSGEAWQFESMYAETQPLSKEGQRAL